MYIHRMHYKYHTSHAVLLNFHILMEHKWIVHITKLKDMLFCPTKPIFMKTEMNETYQNNIIVEHPINASNSILLHTGTNHFIVLTSLQHPEDSEVS